MAELTIRIDLSFGARSLRCVMAAAMILSAVSEVASESVTLTTYYPAPSGVYTQMITTGNTYLARDTNIGCPGSATCGSKVGIGLGAAAPIDLLTVLGNSGNISMGTNYPGWNGMWLNGLGATPNDYNILSSQAAPDLLLNRPTGSSINFRESNADEMIITAGGNVLIGTNVNDAQLDVTAPAGAGLVVHGAAGDTWFPFTDGKNYIRGNTSMGPGSGAPTVAVDVWGQIKATDSISPGNPVCTDMLYPADDSGSPTYCPGGHYATAASGLYAAQWEVPTDEIDGVTDNGGNMLCCPYTVKIY